MTRDKAQRSLGLLGGVAGGVLRFAAAYILLYQLRVPQLLSNKLSLVAREASVSGAKLAEARLSALMGMFVADKRMLALLAASVAAWVVGGRLLSRAWRSLTRFWGRGTRLALFALNVVSTLFWVLALVALLAPILANVSADLPYLRTLAGIARSLDAALVAFMLSALTPFAASLLNMREARSVTGRHASILLALGSLLYALAAIILYLTWRSYSRTLIRGLGAGFRLDAETVSRLLSLFAALFAALTNVLKLVLVASLLLSLGFLGAWLDYRRASRGM